MFKVIIILLCINYSLKISDKKEVKKEIQIDDCNDSIKEIKFVEPSMILSYLKDSINRSLSRNECPLVMYESCIDYERRYILYKMYVWNSELKRKEIRICSDCIQFSLKEDLIDSLEPTQLLRILEICDTNTLKKRCVDSIHRFSEPSICREYSTYELIKKRLKRN